METIIKRIYIIHTQCENNVQAYKGKQNNGKNIIRRKQQNRWNKFNSDIEYDDMHGRQEMRHCKLTRHLNK